MNRLLLISSVMLIISFTGCKKAAKDFVPDCSGTAKTFSGDAFPVFQSSCVNCHSGSGGQSPLNNYTNIVASKSSIRNMIINGSMPSSGKLTDSQKNAIICWIDNGAPNN